MKSNKYEPRVCIICGKTFIPGRKDQRTCASDECKKARQKLNYLEYRAKNYDKVLENNRRSMKQRREKKKRETERKLDGIVAIGYADRQMAASLALAGKVRVEL